MPSFWKDGFSIDETRISLVMVSFMITLIFSLWQFHIHQVFNEDLLTLLMYQLIAITGMNLADKFTAFKNVISQKKSNIGD